MKYNPSLLLPELTAVQSCSRLVIALSGGLDSMVLLHSLHRLYSDGLLNPRLHAIHVNHGISPNADDWQAFCKASCARMQISFAAAKLDLDADATENLEQRARSARYRVFETQLAPADCLLLGHHQDDQMETLLLRLMRGSGARGLAGIPRTRGLGGSQLLRPLLGFSRAALHHYAISENINWVEDDSNQRTEFDRNFCRHELLPLIESRWPGYRESWSKSLQLSFEADVLLDELAASDLAALLTVENGVIQLPSLIALSEPRQRNVLRKWLEDIGFDGVGWQLLTRLTGQILTARADAAAVLAGESGVLARYRDRLYALRKPGQIDRTPQPWSPWQQTSLPLAGNGRLVATPQQHGLSPLPTDTLSVRFRNAGETCRLLGRPEKSLKSLLREAGIVPWLRERQPLLYYGDTLVCIPGIGICEEFAAPSDQPGLAINWEPPDLSYQRSDHQ